MSTLLTFEGTADDKMRAVVQEAIKYIGPLIPAQAVTVQIGSEFFSANSSRKIVAHLNPSGDPWLLRLKLGVFTGRTVKLGDGKLTAMPPLGWLMHELAGHGLQETFDVLIGDLRSYRTWAWPFQADENALFHTYRLEVVPGLLAAAFGGHWDAVPVIIQEKFLAFWRTNNLPIHPDWVESVEEPSMPAPEIRVIAFSGPGRVPRTQPIRLGVLHAMRGNTHPDKQLPATINWFTTNHLGTVQTRRNQGWGPMADFAIGFNPTIGRVEIVQFGDWRTTRSNWGAGFGDSGMITWGVDEVGLAIELDQSASLEEYREETLDALTELATWLMTQPEVDIAPIKIDFWDQDKDKPVPSGWLGHDDTANGKRLGKHDPGGRFNWTRFTDAITGEVTIPVPDPVSPPKPAPDAPVGNLEDRVAITEKGIVTLGTITIRQDKQIADLTKRMAGMQNGLRDAGSVQP